MKDLKTRLETFEDLGRYEKQQILVDTNNDMYEYVGFLDTDRVEVRNFVLDCLNNTIGIAYCEQMSKSGYQTRCDIIN